MCRRVRARTVLHRRQRRDFVERSVVTKLLGYMCRHVSARRLRAIRLLLHAFFNLLNTGAAVLVQY